MREPLPTPAAALTLLRQERRSVAVAYLLWPLAFFGVPFGFPGLNGIHRFYCRKPISGSLWLFSFGLLALARRSGPEGFTLNDALLDLQLPIGLDSEGVRAELERLLHAHLLDVANDERGRVIYREP